MLDECGKRAHSEFVCERLVSAMEHVPGQGGHLELVCNSFEPARRDVFGVYGVA